jgi:hypothetical protein
MASYPKFDIYRHMRMVRISFFGMAVMLMISLFVQVITRRDFGGLPFLLFGIGVFISFSTLVVRLIIRWALRLR